MFKEHSDKTQAQHIAVGGYVRGGGGLQQVAKAKDIETIAFFAVGNNLKKFDLARCKITYFFCENI